jgi:Na+-translocating ferredoxin:NAD+ oxidoreductase RnfG subunit
MKLIILLILAISSIFIRTGDDIDYQPRLLIKEISSLSGSEAFELNEILLPDSVTGNIETEGKFFSVDCKGGDRMVVYIGRVQSCRSGGCAGPSRADFEGESEFFDYFILFDTQKKVIAVRIYNYAATHGQEVTVKGWLKQFSGYDGTKSLRAGKEIDSISGATVSVSGLVADVQDKTVLLKNIDIQ